MEIDGRLQLLFDTGQICRENYDAMLRIVDMFDREWDIKLTEENASMLITHITMTYERARKNDFIDRVENILINELQSSKSYEKSNAALDDIISEIGIDLPEAERGYILVHLCVLFDNI